MSEQEKKQQTGKGILVIGIIAIVVVAVLVGVIIFLLVKQNTKKEEKREVLVTEDNVEEVLDEVEEIAENSEQAGPDYYTVTMETDWHFATSTEASYNAVVINADNNETDVYFDVVLESDESQVLYSSPIIPVGGQLNDIKLDKELSAGSYDAVIIYYLVDENQNPLRTVRVKLQITIEG